MIKVLDMQFIRYANLFDNITRIKTKHCFEYNHTIIFVVPKPFVMRAIGSNNINLEKLPVNNNEPVNDPVNEPVAELLFSAYEAVNAYEALVAFDIEPLK